MYTHNTFCCLVVVRYTTIYIYIESININIKITRILFYIMGILSKTFAAIISSGSIYALYFQYWYNYNRRILLGNQQSMLYASTDIHVITCLTPKDGYDLKMRG